MHNDFYNDHCHGKLLSSRFLLHGDTFRESWSFGWNDIMQCHQINSLLYIACEAIAAAIVVQALGWLSHLNRPQSKSRRHASQKYISLDPHKCWGGLIIGVVWLWKDWERPAAASSLQSCLQLQIAAISCLLQLALLAGNVVLFSQIAFDLWHDPTHIEFA